MTTITECTTPELIEAGNLLLEGMYTTMTPQEMRAGMALMLAENWKMIGVFHGETCKAAVTYRIGYRLYSKKFLQLECLFVHPDHRRDGYAAALFDWAEAKAKQEGCKLVILDSYVENAAGHKFFYARGYHVRGFHFNKEVV
jgi:GNAT superfamily N-acetyltransferase